MNPAWIALGLTAAGIAALAYATPRARAAEPERQERPWLLWSLEPGRAMPTLRGTYTVSTACEVDLVSLANVLPKGARLSCERMNDGGKR